MTGPGRRLERLIDLLAAPFWPAARRRYWRKLLLLRAATRASEDVDRTLASVDASRNASAGSPSADGTVWMNRLVSDVGPVQDPELTALARGWSDSFGEVCRVWGFEEDLAQARAALAEAGRRVRARIGELIDAELVRTRHLLRTYPSRYVRIGVVDLEFEDGHLDTYLLADSHVQQWEFHGTTAGTVQGLTDGVLEEVRIATTGGPALTARASVGLGSPSSDGRAAVRLRGIDPPRLV